MAQGQAGEAKPESQEETDARYTKVLRIGSWVLVLVALAPIVALSVAAWRYSDADGIPHVLAWCIGLLGVSITAGHFLTFHAVRALWTGILKSDPDARIKQVVENRKPHIELLIGLLGITERTLYTCAFAADMPEFIAVWFGAKVAAQWRRWEDERVVFNVFLIGNALSIGFGVLGAKTIEWLGA